MSSRGLASLAIDVSRRSSQAVLAVGLLSVLLILVVGVVASLFLQSVWLWVSLAVLFAATLLQLWQLGLIGRRHAVEWIACDGEGQWWVTTVGKPKQQVKIHPATRVGARAIWLVLSAEHDRFRLLLTPFAMSEVDWRGLQSRLRWLVVAESADQVGKFPGSD